MEERYFNIHDIVKFKIVNTTPFKWQFKNIYGSYENFEAVKTDDLDFIVYLGRFKPTNQDCYITEEKYYIKEDYFYCQKDSYKFTNWEFEMSGFENGDTIIRIFSNIPGYMWMSGFIIDFMIHYKMNEKGYPILHASCVSKDNRGFMFSGSGGTGKTTITMNLLEKGFKMLGDNYIILKKGEVFSYLSLLNIFTYNLAPIIKSNLGVKNKIILGLKEIIYRVTQGYIKIFTKLNPKEIFPELTIDKIKLDTVFLILRKKELKEMQIKKIDKIKLCEYLVTTQMLDNTCLFLPYIAEYSYIFPESKLATYWERYKKNLEENLPDDILIYKVEVPQKYDKEIFEKILEVISI